MRLRTKLLVAAAVLLGLLGSLLVVVDWLIGRIADPAIADYQAKLEPALEAYLREQALLRADPFFTEQRPAGDCGESLNAQLPLAGEAASPARPLALPSDLVQQIRGYRKEWATHAADVNTSALDFSWMKGLHRCDRWDLLSGRGRDAYSEQTRLPLQLGTARTWAQLRLLRGLAEGDLPEASRDVRQLAWLLYSTELVLGGMYAASVLELEGEAWAASGTPGGAPMPAEQIERLRRVLLGGLVFMSPVVPRPISARAYSPQEAPVGLCAQLGERAWGVWRLRGFIEREYAAFVEDFEQTLRNPPPGCRLSFGRFEWERAGEDLSRSARNRRFLGEDRARRDRLLLEWYPGSLAKWAVFESLQTDKFQRLLGPAPRPAHAGPPVTW